MALRTAPFLFFLPVLWSHAQQRDSPVILNITSGSRCLLPCPCPPPPERLVLQWTRPDLQKDGYVWDGRESDLHRYQHLSYLGRVHLQDPHHNCDLVLTNTTTNDTGEYVCLVMYTAPGSTARVKSRHVVQLRVQDVCRRTVMDSHMFQLKQLRICPRQSCCNHDSEQLGHMTPYPLQLKTEEIYQVETTGNKGLKIISPEKDTAF